MIVTGARGVQGTQGAQGKQGEKGEHGSSGAKGEKGETVKGDRGQNAMSVKLEESFYVVSSQQNKKRNDEQLRFNFVRVKQGGKLRKLSQNRELSDDILKVSKDCPSGMQLFAGYCKWNLLKFIEKDIWCLVEDFKIGRRGCSDCFTSVETKMVELEGKKRKVVTQLIYSDSKNQERSYLLTERSCKLLDTYELEKFEFRKCGFFCLMQKLDPLFENDTTFSCTYFPPAFYGVDLGGAHHSSFDLSNKLEMISIELVCS